MDLKNNQSAGGRANNTGKKRGLMIQAPMGSGKSYYIENVVPKEYRHLIVDGDELLDRLKIKNQNRFWYEDSFEKERKPIIDVFQQTLGDGISILYSGNPLLIKTDILVLPDSKIRWERLQERKSKGGFAPNKKQFDREQKAYEKAAVEADKIKVFSDIPNYSEIRKIQETSYLI